MPLGNPSAPRAGRLALIAAVFLTVVLAGCGPVRQEVLRDIAENPSSGAYVEGVPFYPDTGKMCGPAALAGVAAYYGVDATMEDVAETVYHKGLEGALPMDLLIHAKEMGFNAEFYNGGMDDLKDNLSADRPLILFLNLGIKEYPVGHYVVAVGYDEVLGVVLVNSEETREKVMSYGSLERAWARTGYSTLLVTPPAEGEKP